MYTFIGTYELKNNFGGMHSVNVKFLARLGWKLTWTILINFCPASVYLSVHVCLSVFISACKRFTFSTSSIEALGWFQPKLVQSILKLREFKFVKCRVMHAFKGRWLKFNKNLLVLFENLLKNVLVRKSCLKGSLGSVNSSFGSSWSLWVG